MHDMQDVRDTDKALELVRAGGIAYMSDRPALEYVMLSDCKTYAIADNAFNPTGYGFVLPENAPYLDQFNY